MKLVVCGKLFCFIGFPSPGSRFVFDISPMTETKKKDAPYKSKSGDKKWKKNPNTKPKQHDHSATTATVSDGDRKLTKQEKRNLKKQEKLKQNPGQSSHVSNNHASSTAANSSVYKRIPIYPNPYKLNKPCKRLIDSSHPEFDSIVKTSYEGFCIEEADKFDTPFHNQFQDALKNLDQLGFYQFDMTQPAGLGTKVAKTFVTRCLVGDPGMTYKYLGIRMFAHPWTAGATGANDSTVAIGQANQLLTQHAELLNKATDKAEYGSCQFNLTLINRCYPAGEEVTLKLEPMFEKDKLTVSWHADSSLDHYSTIAVYHFNEEELTQKTKKGEVIKLGKPWKAALRVHANAEGPQQGRPLLDGRTIEAPPVVVVLPSPSCYYLLDDFNHHHQHSVVAGSTHRYASTHRVSRREGHTYTYMHQRCQSVLQEKLTADKKNIRRLLLVSHEIEFEWIRQYYLQGSKHHELHTWWHEPIQTLLHEFTTIEKRILRIITALADVVGVNIQTVMTDEPTSSSSTTQQPAEAAAQPSQKAEKKMKALTSTIESTSYEEMREQLQDRIDKRRGWISREEDGIYQDCAVDCRPLPVPLESVDNLWKPLFSSLQIDSDNTLIALESLLEHIQSWGNSFLANQANN